MERDHLIHCYPGVQDRGGQKRRSVHKRLQDDILERAGAAIQAAKERQFCPGNQRVPEVLVRQSPCHTTLPGQVLIVKSRDLYPPINRLEEIQRVLEQSVFFAIHEVSVVCGCNSRCAQVIGSSLLFLHDQITAGVRY